MFLWRVTWCCAPCCCVKSNPCPTVILELRRRQFFKGLLGHDRKPDAVWSVVRKKLPNLAELERQKDAMAEEAVVATQSML